jgi:hypothetical protein
MDAARVLAGDLLVTWGAGWLNGLALVRVGLAVRMAAYAADGAVRGGRDLWKFVFACCCLSVLFYVLMWVV